MVRNRSTPVAAVEGDCTATRIQRGRDEAIWIRPIGTLSLRSRRIWNRSVPSYWADRAGKHTIVDDCNEVTMPMEFALVESHDQCEGVVNRPVAIRSPTPCRSPRVVLPTPSWRHLRPWSKDESVSATRAEKLERPATGPRASEGRPIEESHQSADLVAHVRHPLGELNLPRHLGTETLHERRNRQRLLTISLGRRRPPLPWRSRPDDEVHQRRTTSVLADRLWSSETRGFEGTKGLAALGRPTGSRLTWKSYRPSPNLHHGISVDTIGRWSIGLPCQSRSGWTPKRERALRALEASGLTRSEAIRKGLLIAADELRRLDVIRAEAEVVAADQRDRQETLAIAAFMGESPCRGVTSWS